jgi:anthranilate synthase component 1
VTIDAAFEDAYAAGRAPLVEKRLFNDLETPVSAFLKLSRGAPHPILLESVEGGEKLGRYSVIALKPDAFWRMRSGRAEIAGADGVFRAEPRAASESLRAFIAAARADIPSGAPPMSAGIFGYLGYDFAREFERLPEPKSRPIDMADGWFMRPTLVAIFDNVRHEVTLATPARWAPGVSAEAARKAAEARLDEAAHDLMRPLTSAPTAPRGGLDAPRSNTPPADYIAMVRRAKEYIAAGDIFQAVLSQRFSAPFDAEPFQLYRALRRLNPSPFLFYLDCGDARLVGSSPEILVRVRNGEMTVRPIAGTAPRGASAEEDKRNEARLIADPKERAEHLMLLDLGRNDVGRACEIGSVKVTESFSIERYSHVMHIVSNVGGRLKPGVDAVEALAAGFPAGTVSGAPKIRAMEIIRELERDGRGVYGGAVGYFSADGSMDACIALRTAVLKDGVMHVQAGAGIVADSDPEAEQRECENKAAALFAAARAAMQTNG